MSKQFGTESNEPEWGLYVDEQRRDLTARKSIKVKLPIRQHIKLHALKLFSENNISQTVEVALDLYFDRMRAAELAARTAAQDGGMGAALDVGAGGMPPSVGGSVAEGADVGGNGPGAAPGVGAATPGGAAQRAPQGPAGPGL